MPKFTVDTVDVKFIELKLNDRDNSGDITNYPSLGFIFSVNKRMSKSLLRRLRNNPKFQDYLEQCINRSVTELMDNRFDDLQNAMNIRNVNTSNYDPHMHISYSSDKGVTLIQVSDLLYSGSHPKITCRKDIMLYLQAMTNLPMRLNVV